MGEWIKKMCYTHTCTHTHTHRSTHRSTHTETQWVVFNHKKKKILPFATAWVDLEGIM